MEIHAEFLDDALGLHDFETVITRLGRIADAIAQRGGIAKSEWHLKGYTEEEASLYPVFNGDVPATAALAVTREEFRNINDVTSVGMWAHPEGTQIGGSMTCRLLPQGEPKSIEVSLTNRAEVSNGELINYGDFVHYVTLIAKEFNPIITEVSPPDYFEKRVFDDKPGVGWMLYLPKVITVQQVPEARALIPVPEPDKKQVGTIIVSVADGVFSADNPEHVEVANRIEIRLVDQDLLPAYADI
ncbi:LysR family transcriptional regulator [Trinickia symbiotica]|uniref:LysR family transcriptional regulator n=1 Tax=Trinickia symbiotica TaxID=863227 RepID=A0A2T3XT24_9BURK|nr:LysR family transcriptional regulator [Trinickia symbiotica]